VIPLQIDAQRAPQKGDLLLSEPFLNDDHFSRAVILICETTNEGAFGLILNQTLDLKLLEFMQNIGKFDSIVGIGGHPVSSVVGVAAITEGTNPTAVTWGATAYSTGPYQFGILVQVSDLLVHNSAIEVVDSCSYQVRM
jgi:putative transcriptional regulator